MVFLNEPWNEELTDQLCRSLLSLRTMEETQALLWDIATPDEVKMLARRLEIARLANEGQPYSKIAHALGAGTITIGWIKRTLVREGNGFKLVLERIKKDS